MSTKLCSGIGKEVYKHNLNRIMVLKANSPAIHKLGNLSRKHDDYIRIHSEAETEFIGSFEEGFGFVDVKFQKKDCRYLTPQEIEELNGKWFGINNMPFYQIQLDSEGNLINKR